MSIPSFTGLNTALRGVEAQQAALDVVSHNIANVETPGYSRQEAVFNSTPAMRVGGQTATGNSAQLGTGVEVSTYRPFYIIGQVNRPGQYPYTSNMSALDAIGVAGGFTDHAVESTVHVRHEGESKEFDVPADGSVKIRPGDIVRVDQTVFWDVASILTPAAGAASLAYVLRP